MLPGIDSFYQAFAGRMATINPSRQLGGVLDAADWPPKTILFDAFYLVALGEAALGKDTYSWTVPVYVHTVQFQWISSGTDINNYNNVIGRSRGDRYRTSTAMKEELLQALYPGFTQKQIFSVNASQQLVAAPQNESILWTRPTFLTRLDKDSGKTYVVATVKITDLTESIAA